MLRLTAIPPHLLDIPQPEAVQEALEAGALVVAVEVDPEREALEWELRALRARLSLCAGRMGLSREAIMQEVERVERVVRELRALAGRL